MESIKEIMNRVGRDVEVSVGTNSTEMGSNSARQTTKTTDFFEKIAERCTGKTMEELRSRSKNYLLQSEVSMTWEEPKYDKVNSNLFRNIPKLYENSSFETFLGHDDIVEKVKDKSGKSIILQGQQGCGKTHLAIAAIRYSEVNPYSVEFISVPDLMLMLRSSFGDHSKNYENHMSEAEIIKKYSGVAVLILDDMGADKTSDYTIVSLYIILNSRINSCLQTIITTNLTDKGISEFFGQRIASRLCTFDTIKINAPDYRRLNAAKNNQKSQ